MKDLFKLYADEKNQETKDDELQIEDMEEVSGGANRPHRPGGAR